MILPFYFEDHFMFLKKIKSKMFFRFVELHFSELPSNELSYIIEKRCKISTKAAKKLISVMHELQVKLITLFRV